MNPDNGYIYVRNHISYDINNACKIGKTNNIPERDTQYATGEIKRGHFEAVFELPIRKIGIIERLLQNEFSELNIKYDAGTEFYNKKIITLIEPYLNTIGIKYKKLSKQEISDLIRYNRVRKTLKKINIQLLIQMLKSKIVYKQYIWNERDYQKTIINISRSELLLKNKIYIELPTGGGKSYIVYNLFKYLKSEFIIIVSPRKIINSQNILQKYLQILNEKYVTFNYSKDNNLDEYLKLSNKKIIICCTQSINKIYDKILSNNISNIAIWFDEAHWGIEDSANRLNSDINTQFWLLNDKYIKYRIFTSASPNKSIVLQNENIFGKLYSPIKVKELINLNWLSKIKTYIYSENKQNINNIKYIIGDFSDKNRKFGFSFHNKQKNAFNLFYKHYIEYTNGNTQIKPFLLVGNNFTVEKEPKLKEILLEYDYRNIQIYETTTHSIGYVVAKYSIGYDFNKIDFICLSDPKLSIQDIKQCIGRGIRPDQLGENNSNKEKILILALPVYIDTNIGNKYEKVIEVLQYLLYDIEIPFEEIEFKNKHTTNFKDVEHISNEYNGSNDVKSVLLKLLEFKNKKTALDLTYEMAIKIIADKNIKSKESYYELCKLDNRLSKEPEIVFKSQFTNWIEYLSIERIYYDLDTCKLKVTEYLSNESYFDFELANITKSLKLIDDMFPPYDLWCQYYDINDLTDIIKHNKNEELVEF